MYSLESCTGLIKVSAAKKWYKRKKLAIRGINRDERKAEKLLQLMKGIEDNRKLCQQMKSMVLTQTCEQKGRLFWKIKRDCKEILQRERNSAGSFSEVLNQLKNRLIGFELLALGESMQNLCNMLQISGSKRIDWNKWKFGLALGWTKNDRARHSVYFLFHARKNAEDNEQQSQYSKRTINLVSINGIRKPQRWRTYSRVMGLRSTWRLYAHIFTSRCILLFEYFYYFNSIGSWNLNHFDVLSEYIQQRMFIISTASL